MMTYCTQVRWSFSITIYKVSKLYYPYNVNGNHNTSEWEIEKFGTRTHKERPKNYRSGQVREKKIPWDNSQQARALMVICDVRRVEATTLCRGSSDWQQPKTPIVLELTKIKTFSKKRNIKRKINRKLMGNQENGTRTLEVQRREGAERENPGH